MLFFCSGKRKVGGNVAGKPHAVGGAMGGMKTHRSAGYGEQP